MFKKLIIVALFLGCISFVISYYLKQPEVVYHKSYSPDGQYSRYAIADNYFSELGPFSKFSDHSGKVVVYDEIEKNVVGSHPIEMISMIDGMDWNETNLTKRGNFSIELPRKINAKLLARNDKSVAVVYDWSLYLQGKKYAVHKKDNRLTVKNEKDKVVLKDIKYIAQINNDSVQVLDKNTKIKYYNSQLKEFDGTQKSEPHILEVCGNVTTYSLKIEENDGYYVVKKAVGFTSSNFENYRVIDSIRKNNIKDIYFLNNKRHLTYDDNFSKYENIIIKYDSYFGILEPNYGIQYFDSLDIASWPIQVMKNNEFGYYNTTPTKYVSLESFEFHLAAFTDAKNRTGYIDRNGNQYYK